MKRTVFALALFAATAASAAEPTTIPVQTGRGEFAQFPQLKRKNIPYDYNVLIAWTSKILSDGSCKLKGQRPQKFDIDVPYAALVEPDGTVKRIIISEMGCPSLETMVGSTIVEMVKRGDIKPTGQDQALWFGDRIAFARDGD